MKLLGHELEGIAKVLALLVVVLLVASGLCGLQFLITTNSPGGLGQVFISLGAVELIAILLSLAGIFVVLVILGGRALYQQVAHSPKEGPQKLFEDDDDKDSGS